MNDEQIRTKLIRWARWHWGVESELREPEVVVLWLKRLEEGEEEGEWEAELSISSSEDNPTVTFFIDQAGRLHVDAIEY